MAKSKTKNRNLLTFFLTLLAFIIGLLVALVFARSYLTYTVLFQVSNPTRIINLGDEFTDDTYRCIIKDKDYHDDVLIKYYDLEGNELPLIDTSKEGTYLVKYLLDKDGYYLETEQILKVSKITDFEINILMTGNQNTGDTIYIKAGENDILIDAGSDYSSAKVIRDYLDGVDGTTHSYVTDNKLEYVIATHAHKDHIAGFVGSEGIFQNYEIETLIDFSQSNSTSKLYSRYVKEVETLEQNGTKHYTAKECFNEENGALKTYELGYDLKMEVLYNPYYELKTSNENNYSVCLLFTQGSDKYLFTGDLEADGESALIDYYANTSKFHDLYFYKAGHHGSNTASSMKLLEVCKPSIVAVSCVAFRKQYTDNMDNTFPAKQTVENFYKAGVKHLYVTQIVSDNKDGYEKANGNIILRSDASGKRVICSNKSEDFYNGEAFPLFKKYRSWGSN